MAPNDSPRTRREREIAKQRAQAQAQQDAYRRAARRRGAVGVGVVVFVLLAVFGVIRAATGEKSATTTTTTTPSGRSTTTTPYTGPTASLPTAPPGSVLTTAAGCPPRDGSAPRVTQFAAPPPECLEPNLDYTARIRTSRGSMIVDINEKAAPAAANSFVYLALYHYYDGLPFTSVRKGAYAEVADPVNSEGQRGPGYTVPKGNQVPGILSPNSLVMTPGPNGVGGGLTLAMPGQQYTEIPQDAPRIGDVLLGFAEPRRPEDPERTVQQEINDTATPGGAPTAVITIDKVDIAACPPENIRCYEAVFGN